MTQNAPARSTFWNMLLEPHAGLRKRRQRQRATLLAAITLTLAVVVTPPVLYVLIVLRETRAAVGLAHIGVMLIAYAASRTTLASWGGIFLVFGQALVNMATMLVLPDPVIATANTGFMLLPVLIATVVVPSRVTAGLVVLINAFLVVFMFTTTAIAPDEMLPTLILTLVISSMAAVVSFILERDLNVIEQQADELGRRSHVLQAEADERTRAVLITADIGKMMTGARDTDEMLKQVANLIIGRFDLYHAQIFLVDSASKKALLRAASGSVGEELMAAGHSIPLGTPSVVTRVVARGEAVVVNDSDTDPIHRRNELLPLTRSEIGLPLRVSGQVIGALNIQSVTPNDFKMADVAMFQTIADQMAVAIENARLFQRAQRDLEDIETLNRQLTGEAWRSYLSGRAANAPVGFASTDGTVTAMDSPDGAATEPDRGTVSLPLKIRGETIGMLDVTSHSGELPDEETQAMLRAVAERVALALDSTRLGELSQRQAEREQILAKISADLQATTDMNAILRVVARESSRALGAPRSFIHLALDYEKEK